VRGNYHAPDLPTGESTVNETFRELVKLTRHVIDVSRQIDTVKAAILTSLDPGVYLVDVDGETWSVTVRRTGYGGTDPTKRFEVSVKPTTRVS
jgi:hypothetical protein